MIKKDSSASEENQAKKSSNGAGFERGKGFTKWKGERVAKCHVTSRKMQSVRDHKARCATSRKALCAT